MAATIGDSVFVISIPWLVGGLVVIGLLTYLFTMAPRVYKRTRNVMTLDRKLEIMEKMDAGWSVTKCAAHFNVPARTLYDLRKTKGTLLQYRAKFGTGNTKKKARKHLGKVKYPQVDKATITWLRQMRTGGLHIRGLELKNAAMRFANDTGEVGFRASDGWLNRFKARHGLTTRHSHGESLDADSSNIEPFRTQLQDLIQTDRIHLNQLYNADESGLNYRNLPSTTLAFDCEKKVPGRKTNKERISVLCGANATGTHRLRPVVVGKAKTPRCLRSVMDRLPVVWYHQKKAWFTGLIFTDWFFHHFVPEVIQHQTETLGVARDQVRALLLLDNAPAHPAADHLVAEDGRIRVLYLPPNTTALIQPMDQGVIVSAKRGYCRRLLDDVLVTQLGDDEGEGDTRATQTRVNIKAYNIKSALHNWANAWKDVPIKTLENAWSRLLKGIDLEHDFEGFEAHTFLQRFRDANEQDVTVDDVQEWLDDDGGDPGYQLLSDAEIVANALRPEGDTTVSSDDDGEEDPDDDTDPLPRLRELRDALETCISYAEHPDVDVTMLPKEASDIFRVCRDAVIKRQNSRSYRQVTLDSFFSPPPAAPPPARPPRPPPPPAVASTSSTAHAEDVVLDFGSDSDCDDPPSAVDFRYTACLSLDTSESSSDSDLPLP